VRPIRRGVGGEFVGVVGDQLTPLADVLALRSHRRDRRRGLGTGKHRRVVAEITVRRVIAVQRRVAGPTQRHQSVEVPERRRPERRGVVDLEFPIRVPHAPLVPAALAGVSVALEYVPPDDVPPGAATVSGPALFRPRLEIQAHGSGGDPSQASISA
jgi:hypothetical protein